MWGSEAARHGREKKLDFQDFLLLIVNIIN